jgi:hypothetical protein
MIVRSFDRLVFGWQAEREGQCDDALLIGTAYIEELTIVKGCPTISPLRSFNATALVDDGFARGQVEESEVPLFAMLMRWRIVRPPTSKTARPAPASANGPSATPRAGHAPRARKAAPTRHPPAIAGGQTMAADQRQSNTAPSSPPTPKAAPRYPAPPAPQRRRGRLRRGQLGPRCRADRGRRSRWRPLRS